MIDLLFGIGWLCYGKGCCGGILLSTLGGGFGIKSVRHLCHMALFNDRQDVVNQKNDVVYTKRAA